ncbi:MAG: hypothetical protein R2854_31355 [Caldilineaceae bacterium]
MADAWREANLARYHAETMLGVVNDQRGDYDDAAAHYAAVGHRHNHRPPGRRRPDAPLPPHPGHAAPGHGRRYAPRRRGHRVLRTGGAIGSTAKVCAQQPGQRAHPGRPL